KKLLLAGSGLQGVSHGVQATVVGVVVHGVQATVAGVVVLEVEATCTTSGGMGAPLGGVSLRPQWKMRVDTERDAVLAPTGVTGPASTMVIDSPLSRAFTRWALAPSLVFHDFRTMHFCAGRFASWTVITVPT